MDRAHPSVRPGVGACRGEKAADTIAALMRPSFPIFVSRRLGLAIACLVACAAVLSGAPALGAVADPADTSLSGGERLTALLDRIKEKQASLESLEARFVQTKNSLLLLEAEESRGHFAYQAPDRARWEFTSPNQTVMIIRGDEMLTWYRDLGTAERVSVGSQASKVEQYLSATNSIVKLERYFNMAAAFPKDDERPYRIELTPRYKRVAKRLEKMTIWFDRERYVPVRLELVEPDGDVTDFVFEQVEINPEIAADRFALELPADVEIETIDLAGR